MENAGVNVSHGIPQRRRRRPPVNCLRSKSSNCVYDRLSPPPSRRPRHARTSDLDQPEPDIYRFPKPTDQFSDASRYAMVPSYQSDSTSGIANSTEPSTPASQSSSREVESLRIKIQQLEDQMSRAKRRSAGLSAPSPTYNIATTTSHIAGTFHVQEEVPADGRIPTTSRTIMHKARVFGQSHWMNGVAQFGDILQTIEPLVRNETSKAFYDLQRCKYLGKLIKTRRKPSWPAAPTAELPPKDVADVLVEVYIRTFETVYRILHIPTFRRDYDALWLSGTPPDMSFLVQLKLIFAIGATMHDDKFSLRTSAIRWVYEAQTWISEPEFKSRLNIQFLQTTILLLLARENVGVDGGLIWISTGELFRTAVYMGLNRDPIYLPKRTIFVTEMRRRLWNTIMELVLSTSMVSGGPPLFSLEDFDTHPPGSFDDEQIMSDDPISKPEQAFTQMSVALALRKLFPLRLAIVRSLNALGAHMTYEETIHVDSELRRSYKAIFEDLKSYGPASGTSQFGIRTLDWLVRRYLLALHLPFFAGVVNETAFAFSRRVVVENALKIWCAIHPSSLMASNANEEQNITQQDLTRLAQCGSGPFRTSAMQACFLIASELKTQLQEEDSLGPVPLRRDLLCVIEDYKNWNLRCIEAGETNTKGYLFTCLVYTQINALMMRASKEKLPYMLLQTAEDAEALCLSILEKKAGEGQDSGVNFDDINDLEVDGMPDLLGNWAFMVSS
ncbi:hypothetical protein N7476_010711 [Penicillium atrosanguineum]|uniref:Xylanolytic transcriptional activator regulatory domain-containing protein n=1 Tax=Penicillium atrosanguineum TaxID=1132637 RepID=A0A9W9PN42_9EURO|nr:hypothetical protein N7476_010711 [Penicillium atrosanguineum]